MMQTKNVHSPSAEQSEARTISEVEETPEQQTLLWEDMPAEDPAPIARNTDKGKGKEMPPSSKDNHDGLLSPQKYKRLQMSTTEHILYFELKIEHGQKQGHETAVGHILCIMASPVLRPLAN